MATSPIFDIALAKRFTDAPQAVLSDVTSNDTLLIRNVETSQVMRLPFSILASAIAAANASSNPVPATSPAPTGGAITSDIHEIMHKGFYVGASASLDLSINAISSNSVWRLVVMGAFANNSEGGVLNPPAGIIEVGEINNLITVGSAAVQFSRNPTTGKLRVINTSGSVGIQFNGLMVLSSFALGVSPSESIRVAGSAIVGKFGANGATPQGKKNLGPDATDLSSALPLLNQIRALLIANGQGQ